MHASQRFGQRERRDEKAGEEACIVLITNIEGEYKLPGIGVLKYDFSYYLVHVIQSKDLLLR